MNATFKQVHSTQETSTGQGAPVGTKGQAEGLAFYIDAVEYGLDRCDLKGPWATRTPALPEHQKFSGTATVDGKGCPKGATIPARDTELQKGW